MTRCFTVDSVTENDRVDCAYYSPQYFETLQRLKRISKTTDSELVTLSEILEHGDKKSITGGSTPLGAAYLPEGVPFIRVQNVKETGLELSKVVFVSQDIHQGELKRSQLQSGDVLITITGTFGGYVGLSAVVPNGFGPANINQHVVRVLVDKARVVPEFMAMFLNSKFGRSQTDREATGETRFGLDYASIRNLKLVLPKKTVQEDIVAEVRSIYQRAEQISSQIPALEESYDQIVFSSLNLKLPSEPKIKTFFANVENGERLEVNWYYPYYAEVLRLLRDKGSIPILELKHGLKYGASLDADYSGDIPFLRIENLRRNQIDTSDMQFIPSSVYSDEVANLYLREGDVLFERSGTYVGLCAYVQKGFEEHVYGSYIIRLRLMDESISPRYLSVFMNSILGRIQFDRLKTGALQFDINMQHIRGVEVIRPERKLQEAIADEVFSAIEQVNKLKALHRKTLDEASSRFVNRLENG